MPTALALATDPKKRKNKMHKTSNRRSPKRHHSTITADKAFKMVIELTASIEKRNKRQRIDARTATPMATANSTSIMTSPTSATRIRDKRNNYNGFRNDYSLGEVARSSSHMITNMEQQPYSSENGHTQAIDASLRNHDYAFVKRSNGTYTYSVLAYRDANTLAFVMCESCSIKLVKRQYWHDHVRLVSMEGSVMMMENGEDCSLSAMMATATISSGRLVPSKINNASRHSYHSPTANGRSYHQSPTFTLPKYEDTRVSMADAYSKTLAGDKIPQRIFIVSPVVDNDDEEDAYSYSPISDVSIPKLTAIHQRNNIMMHARKECDYLYHSDRCWVVGESGN